MSNPGRVIETPEARGIPRSAYVPRDRFTIVMKRSGFWRVCDAHGEYITPDYRLYRGAEYQRRALALYRAGKVEEAGKYADWAYMSDKGIR